MWILIFSYLVFLIDNEGELYVYAIPFAIAPIIILNFYKKYLALYLHITIVLIASLITKLGYEFTVLQLLVGMVTILIFSELRFWNKFFRGILVIFITYVIGYISLSLINSASFAEIDWRIIVSFFINALLLLLAYPFIPLIEKPFGYISKITISELGDLNKPLLKELSLKAPGTLQHSLQVANLCEAAAEEIGANSLLIKVGAMYHDIGKTYAPEFFIENQRKGENPYENLDYFESAERIFKHVTLGEKMAIKARLPRMLQRFIITHHGTTRVEYFYRKQMNEFPDKEFDETIFRYPGPKPKTKEESIIMIADSIEAAAKSLNKPSSNDIDQLVEKITKFKIDDGQLDESELTFEEVNKIKEVFKNIVKNIHHIRIEYPKLNNQK
jgi:putative nucleotidyltransferase with HDIG domain